MAIGKKTVRLVETAALQETGAGRRDGHEPWRMGNQELKACLLLGLPVRLLACSPMGQFPFWTLAWRSSSDTTEKHRFGGTRERLKTLLLSMHCSRLEAEFCQGAEARPADPIIGGGTPFPLSQGFCPATTSGWSSCGLIFRPQEGGLVLAPATEREETLGKSKGHITTQVRSGITDCAGNLPVVSWGVQVWGRSAGERKRGLGVPARSR